MPINFENKTLVKLKAVDKGSFNDIIGGIIPSDERILQTFKAGRDGVVFTDRRLIALNMEGITGKQKTISIIPYSKISTYEIQTASVIDMDSRLTVWVGGLGTFTFEFTARSDLGSICRCINGCND